MVSVNKNLDHAFSTKNKYALTLIGRIKNNCGMIVMCW